MRIKLKEKHLCLIIAEVSYRALAYVFKLVSQIKTKCQGAEPDDLIEIDTTPSELWSIYVMFANKPEGMYSVPNQEMNETLLAQLTQMLADGSDPNATEVQLSEKAEAEQVLAKIQAIKADYETTLLNAIADGRQLIQ